MAQPAATLRLASFPPVISTNPYQRLLYGALARCGVELVDGARFDLGWLRRARHRVDTLHFHWPESYYRYDGRLTRFGLPLSYVRLVLMTIRLRAARMYGYRIVWTVHQVVPHETTSRRLDRAAARTLARSCDALVALDEETADRARECLGEGPARKLTVVPHGFYVGVYPKGRTADEVRATLGIQPGWTVALCFGLLRAYKDIGLLLDAFRLTDLPRTALVIAGPAIDDEVGRVIGRAAAADPRIRPLLEFIPDEQVAELFNAADIAVVARSDGGTSGSSALSLSLGTPLVAARTRASEALLGGESAGWLFEPGDAKSLRQTLETALADPAEIEARGSEALRRASSLPWSTIAEQTIAVLA